MKENFSDSELKKARRAIWLYRLFGRDIPVEYEELIVRRQCCSSAFMRRYVLLFWLTPAAERVFFDIFLPKTSVKEDKVMLKNYISCHGAIEDNQIKIMQNKDADLIVTLLCYFGTLFHGNRAISSQALETLITLGDTPFIEKVLSTFFKQQTWLSAPQVWKKCFSYAYASRNIELFTAITKLRVYVRGLDSDYETELFQNPHRDMIKTYRAYWRLSEKTLLALIRGKIKTDLQEEILLDHLEQQAFSSELQNALVEFDCQEVLKKHFEKYGLSPQALEFWNNKRCFKEAYNL